MLYRERTVQRKPPLEARQAADERGGTSKGQFVKRCPTRSRRYPGWECSLLPYVGMFAPRNATLHTGQERRADTLVQLQSRSIVELWGNDCHAPPSLSPLQSCRCFNFSCLKHAFILEGLLKG